ncbi:hypothetical protein K1719_010798 [Acacia pycnantha]|nr:hypothetical protein K1719_010798 [Acacia pycnantha]
MSCAQKALPIAYDILLEELLQFSKAIAQAIDTSKFVSKESIVSLTNSILQASQVASSMEVSIQGKPENGLEGLKDALDFIKAEKICSLSKSKLLSLWRSNALLVELIFKSSLGKQNKIYKTPLAHIIQRKVAQSVSIRIMTPIARRCP